MPENEVDNSIALSVNSAIERFRTVLLAVLVVAVLAVVGIVIGVIAHGKSVSSGIEQLDTIEFVLLKDASSLSESDISQRLQTAENQLLPLSKKGGTVGSRASLLLADVYFQQEKFEQACDSWVRAAQLKKNAYTTYISYYNAGVASEQLGELDKAISYYESASKDDEFPLVDHALFSLGRVQEGKGDFSAAVSAYTRLNDIRPSSKWANTAKSRMIALKQSGAIE